MTTEDATKKLQAALAEQKLLRAKTASNFTQQEDEEGGEEGGGQTGTGTAIEKRMFVETFGLLRNGEKQFGMVNEFDPLAYLAKSEQNLKGELSHERGNRLKAHPILSQLSKFDGDTPNMSMDPNQNPQAEERYENRLQLQMAMQNRPKVTPKPGGM